MLLEGVKDNLLLKRGYGDIKSVFDEDRCKALDHSGFKATMGINYIKSNYTNSVSVNKRVLRNRNLEIQRKLYFKI